MKNGSLKISSDYFFGEAQILHQCMGIMPTLDNTLTNLKQLDVLLKNPGLI